MLSGTMLHYNISSISHVELVLPVLADLCLSCVDSIIK